MSPRYDISSPGPEVVKLFIHSTQLSMNLYHAHKYQNANNCWHFILTFICLINTTSESLKQEKSIIFINLVLCAVEISFSVELRMKKVL